MDDRQFTFVNRIVVAGLEAPLAPAATISHPGPAPATRQTLIVDTDFYPGPELNSTSYTSYNQYVTNYIPIPYLITRIKHSEACTVFTHLLQFSYLRLNIFKLPINFGSVVDNL